VGESFRSLVNVNVVRASYVVASGYVVADTLDKSQRISDVLTGRCNYCERLVKKHHRCFFVCSNAKTKVLQFADIKLLRLPSTLCYGKRLRQ